MRTHLYLLCVLLSLNATTFPAKKKISHTTNNRELLEIERIEAYEKSSWRLERIKTVIVCSAAIFASYVTWRFLGRQHDLSTDKDETQRLKEELKKLQNCCEQKEKELKQALEQRNEAYNRRAPIERSSVQNSASSENEPVASSSNSGGNFFYNCMQHV